MAARWTIPAVLVAALCSLAAPRPRAADAVDVLLVLAADVSRSIDDEEFALQRRGYAAAITNPQVLGAIAAGEHRAIGLAFVEWSGETEQTLVADWTVIRGPAHAGAFAAALLAAPRSDFGHTAIGSALDYSVGLLAKSGFDAPRHLIDVSGDGTSDQGTPVNQARDAAVAGGTVINGLAIFNKRAAAGGGPLAAHTNPPGGIAKYYRQNVIGGAGAFVEQIDDFSGFGEAMVRKLLSEIALRDGRRPKRPL